MASGPLPVGQPISQLNTHS